MTGELLKNARKARGWTQAETSRRLKVTQAYVSMLEKGRRPLPARLARRTLRVLALPPTSLPLPQLVSPGDQDQQFFAEQLAALGYLGFAYLRHHPVQLHPAQLLVMMLMCDEVESRLVEGLPYLPYRYFDMDWDWVLRQCKLNDVQNRLGYVVELARQLADQRRSPSTGVLGSVLDRIKPSRLAEGGTLCHESMTQVERRWLRENRPVEAREWNLLTDLKAEHLVHVE